MIFELDDARDMSADMQNDSELPSLAEALAAGDIHALRACPKADLHTHGFAKAD